MGNISKGARESLKWINKRPELPEWWAPMQILVVVLVVLFLSIKIMSGDISFMSSSTDTKIADNFVPIESINSDQPTAAPEDSLDTTPLPDTAVTVVALASDSSLSVSVPTASVSVAKTAAAALFTGISTNVILPPGVIFPKVANPAPTADVVSITVNSNSSDFVSFSVGVDLQDGLGSRLVSVATALQAGTWLFTPTA